MGQLFRSRDTNGLEPTVQGMLDEPGRLVGGVGVPAGVSPAVSGGSAGWCWWWVAGWGESGGVGGSAAGAGGGLPAGVSPAVSGGSAGGLVVVAGGEPAVRVDPLVMSGGGAVARTSRVWSDDARPRCPPHPPAPSPLHLPGARLTVHRPPGRTSRLPVAPPAPPPGSPPRGADGALPVGRSACAAAAWFAARSVPSRATALAQYRLRLAPFARAAAPPSAPPPMFNPGVFRLWRRTAFRLARDAFQRSRIPGRPTSQLWPGRVYASR